MPVGPVVESVTGKVVGSRVLSLALSGEVRGPNTTEKEVFYSLGGGRVLEVRTREGRVVLEERIVTVKSAPNNRVVGGLRREEVR